MISENAVKIRLEDGPSKGRYVASIESLPEAQMTFSRTNPRLVIIDHTEVPDAMRGMGVGKALVGAIVADAREKGFKIIPLCPFAKATLERRPEWRDVLG